MNKNDHGLEQLIEKGVEKLKQFGFVNVTKENIFSDEVYCFFLIRFMNSFKGKSSSLDAQIDYFLRVMKKAK
jgi:hypothetical protein